MQDSLLKSDIFFFVATLALTAISLMLLVGLAYLIAILRIIKRIGRSAESGAATIASGLEEAKTAASQANFAPAAVYSIFKNLYHSRNKKHAAKK